MLVVMLGNLIFKPKKYFVTEAYIYVEEFLFRGDIRRKLYGKRGKEIFHNRFCAGSIFEAKFDTSKHRVFITLFHRYHHFTFWLHYDAQRVTEFAHERGNQRVSKNELCWWNVGAKYSFLARPQKGTIYFEIYTLRKSRGTIKYKTGIITKKQ